MIRLDTLAHERTAEPRSLAPFADLIAAAARLDLPTAQTETVAALLRAARFDDASLAPFVHFGPERYTRNCVYRDERFELLVLCWADNAASPIHDHGGSRCFVSVQRGSLTVENYSVDEGGREAGPVRLSAAGTQVLRAGAIDARGADRDVHRVRASGGPAISLHLYAKPLDACLVFDAARQTCRVAVNRYDRLAPEVDRNSFRAAGRAGVSR